MKHLSGYNNIFETETFFGGNRKVLLDIYTQAEHLRM